MQQAWHGALNYSTTDAFSSFISVSVSSVPPNRSPTLAGGAGWHLYTAAGSMETTHSPVTCHKPPVMEGGLPGHRLTRTRLSHITTHAETDPEGLLGLTSWFWLHGGWGEGEGIQKQESDGASCLPRKTSSGNLWLSLLVLLPGTVGAVPFPTPHPLFSDSHTQATSHKSHIPCLASVPAAPDPGGTSCVPGTTLGPRGAATDDRHRERENKPVNEHIKPPPMGKREMVMSWGEAGQEGCPRSWCGI